jgi:hypothetical protein
MMDEAQYASWIKLVVVVVVFIDKQQDKSSWTPSYSQHAPWIKLSMVLFHTR